MFSHFLHKSHTPRTTFWWQIWRLASIFHTFDEQQKGKILHCAKSSKLILGENEATLSPHQEQPQVRVLPKWQIVSSASDRQPQAQRRIASLKPGSAPQKATLLTKSGPQDVRKSSALANHFKSDWKSNHYFTIAWKSNHYRQIGSWFLYFSNNEQSAIWNQITFFALWLEIKSPFYHCMLQR